MRDGGGGLRGFFLVGRRRVLSLLVGVMGGGFHGRKDHQCTASPPFHHRYLGVPCVGIEWTLALCSVRGHRGDHLRAKRLVEGIVTHLSSL